MKQGIRTMGKLILAATLTAGLLSACSGTKNEGASPSGGASAASSATLPEVTLKLYFPDQKKPMFDEVWNAIAEKTKDKLNVKFDVQFVPWNDYRDKIKLLSASGDNFDAYFDANWNIYDQMVAQGALLDIAPLLPKYAPTLYKKYEELNYIKPISTGGKIYAAPWTIGKALRPYFIYRADLAEKYNVDMSNVKTVEDLEPYLKAIKDNEPDVLPTWWAKGAGANNFAQIIKAYTTKYELDAVSNGLVYDLNDASHKIVPLEQTQAFREAAHTIRRWYEAGYISKDSISMEQKDQFGNGRSAGFWHEIDSAVSVKSFEVPGAINAGVNLYPDKKFRNDSPLGNVIAINKNAANPERMLMFLELLSTDRDVYDMVLYGIEGKTYVKDGDKVKYPEGLDASKSTYLDWPGQWAFWRSGFVRPDDTRPQSYWDAMQAAVEDPTNIMTPLGSFSPNYDAIKTEIAKRDAVADELLRVIEFGLDKDVDKAVDDYIAKQKAAGTDKIVEELQKQVDAYLAANG